MCGCGGAGRCTIDWKAGKNATVTIETKKQRHKCTLPWRRAQSQRGGRAGPRSPRAATVSPMRLPVSLLACVHSTASKKTRVVKREVPKLSFFNYFAAEELAVSDDTDEELEEKINADFDMGDLIRQYVVPNAIEFLTGEALGKLGDEEEDEVRNAASPNSRQPATDVAPWLTLDGLWAPRIAIRGVHRTWKTRSTATGMRATRTTIITTRARLAGRCGKRGHKPLSFALLDWKMHWMCKSVGN